MKKKQKSNKGETIKDVQQELIRISKQKITFNSLKTIHNLVNCLIIQTMFEVDKFETKAEQDKSWKD